MEDIIWPSLTVLSDRFRSQACFPATLSEYRGKGVYTALMAKRLADARALGMEAAVLQADRTTSAPICANLGFEEVCSLDLYAWGNG